MLLLSVIGVPAGDASPRPDHCANQAVASLVSRGEGPTVVLLSGLLGGISRLEPLADRLVSRGFRVVAVDPYRLCADSPDVSFDGLARGVAGALRRESVHSAIVVAHGHAAGIAVRLAAGSEQQVTSLILLDAGLVVGTRSAGVERALRIAAIAVRIPGGKSFIRDRLVSGIRANSGDSRWLSDSVADVYVTPMLRDIEAVSRMAARLGDAREPEPVTSMLARVHAEVLVLLGASPHPSSATAAELALLERIPGTRIRELRGVGHFVHEEAPDAVVHEVLAARERRIATLR